ncbi:MAG: hypothetical protein K5663_04420 [Clostridiales bacterium]|nr:hypothetical protein [Clostridiales bacterium]
MREFLTVMLIFLPFAIALSVWLEVDKKRYNNGTRSVDKLITKTRIIAVNGVEYVTEKGVLSNAVVGRMLAGDIGMYLGAVNSKQVHRDNEFTFLVFYSEKKSGSKKVTEKVCQSSGRFSFLVSKLEDTQKTEYPAPTVPEAKKAAQRRPGSFVVPVGEYIVGEDVPAGVYTLTSDDFSEIDLYRDEDDEDVYDSFDCSSPLYTIGKITLNKGMKIKIYDSALTFSPYTGLDLGSAGKAK